MTPAWARAVLACPRCGRGLRGWSKSSPVVRCDDCGPYPVLGGVPILVPEPASWCARHADAALAALAEQGRANAVAVETVKAFASAERHVEPTAFSDDWTSAESHGGSAPRLVEGPATDALDELISVAAAQSPSQWLEHRAPNGLVVEVGCGAGLTSARLATKGRRLISTDLSLRAVLHAERNAGSVPVVADAEALPFAKRSLGAVVAENVVDLLDDPSAFFASVTRCLGRNGALLLCTPEPSLGAPDDDDAQLEAVAKRSGLRAVESIDGLPWLRRNSSRFLEVWLVRAVVLRPRR